MDCANPEDLATDLGHSTRLVVVEGEAYDPGKRRRNRPGLVVDDAVRISEPVRF